MKSRKTMLALLVLSLMLAACIAGPNPAEGIASEEDEVAGFWRGLWHGIISPVTFVISLFVEDVHFYEVHNNGGWYNFGFVAGAGIIFGGGPLGSRRARRRWG